MMADQTVSRTAAQKAGSWGDHLAAKSVGLLVDLRVDLTVAMKVYEKVGKMVAMTVQT